MSRREASIRKYRTLLEGIWKATRNKGFFRQSSRTQVLKRKLINGENEIINIKPMRNNGYSKRIKWKPTKFRSYWTHNKKTHILVPENISDIFKDEIYHRSSGGNEEKQCAGKRPKSHRGNEILI